MIEGKYSKLISFEPIGKSSHPDIITNPMIRYNGKELANADFTYSLTYITQPLLMIKEPHKHDFDQFVCFIGGDPSNFKDFDAEIELYLGDEKYIINKTATVYLPKGLVHGPLFHKTVNKPYLFLDIAVTGNYVKIPVTK
jgi:hypothetical protein